MSYRTKTMMLMMMNIDFDRVVEQNSLMLMKVHENYFDVAMEENLLVVIRTNFNEKKSSINRRMNIAYIFLDLCLRRRL